MAGSWLERAVDAVYGMLWPARAVSRRHFRRLESDPEYREAVGVGLRLRGYRAADSRAGQTPWTSGVHQGQPADVEILWDLATLRNRSRELGRDDPLASGLLQEFVRKVVGTGLVPQSRATDRELNPGIEAAFLRGVANLSPADGLHYYARQRMICRRLLEDGEVFLVSSMVGDDLVVEVVEGDRVATPFGSVVPQDERGEIRAGVEKDSDGWPVAYWVRKLYPVERTTGTSPVPAAIGLFSMNYAADAFERVPADRVYHLKLTNRPGQTRGVPLLHAVMQDLRDLDLLLLASLKRVQIAACLAVFLESAESATNLLDLTAQTYGYQLDQDLEPGMIFKLFPGEKVSYLNPSFPTADLDTFATLLARRIGAALGVSWQTVLKDWSRSNYSSARTQIIDDDATFLGIRNDLQDALRWERLQVLQHMQLLGDEDLAGVDADELDRVFWIAPGRDWVDPKKEAEAVAIKLQLGLTTLRDEIAGQGRDWEDVLRQRLEEELRERELREELGLGPKPEPAAPGAPAAEDEAEDEAEETPEAEDAEDEERSAYVVHRYRRNA